ncbi:MAG: hypothetical protein P1U86_22455 [Verrucomicrobiales bacterium]|nr:hypothetical protein [Verrucomicrobiales bacterium]
MIRTLTFLLTIFITISVSGNEKPDTQFLIPGELIFAEEFTETSTFEKPTWYLRRSSWEVKDGVLRGVNEGGNGPFIRLQSKENDGPLPEDYIMTFSFKIEENPDEKKSNKHHETRSSGQRFSVGHYAAKIQWRPDIGMDLNIGHGDALEDDSFYVEKGKWYHITMEIRGDEIVASFKDGPTYYLQHDHFREKPQGWEFFTHISEVAFLDNMQVWSLADGEHPEWKETRSSVLKLKNRSFLSSENPDFQITKEKTN